jgi:hypothetical protein
VQQLPVPVVHLQEELELRKRSMPDQGRDPVSIRDPVTDRREIQPGRTRPEVEVRESLQFGYWLLGWSGTAGDGE